MKYVLGLTGGTGAGKSEISRYMESRGAYVIDADEVSREVTKPGAPALCEIEAVFPGVVKDGVLDRRALGAIVFADAEKLSVLSKITHRYIRALTEEEVSRRDGWIVLDAPLLYEAGEDALCDAVVFVTAEDTVRLSRIMARDGLSRREAIDRVNARDLSEVARHADFILENNGELSEAIKNLDVFLKTKGLIE